MANQDSLISTDGSGSVREGGVNILKNHALELWSKQHSGYFGAGEMKVGLNECGKGISKEDGVTGSPRHESPQPDSRFGLSEELSRK